MHSLNKEPSTGPRATNVGVVRPIVEVWRPNLDAWDPFFGVLRAIFWVLLLPVLTQATVSCEQ